METIHRDILQELKNKIVDDLDVNNILNQLTTERVLRNEEVLQIRHATSREGRAKILLDILPSCGPHAFNIFHQSLRHHYSWLSNDIDRILNRRRIDVIDAGLNSPGSPNLPPQSPMTVNREAKMEEMKSALTKLQPGSYLVVHGMKGFGKSCLTANTLKDTSLVRKLFTNQVYWIKFGYERTIEDEILIQLNFLYHQVRNSDSLNSPMTSEPLKVHLIHYLRHYFAKSNNRNALLILDDVWNKEIIDAFDFHCKTLVITTDIDFLEGKQLEIIEMKKGFTESESLGLFAKSLETTVDKLPREAKKIHDECNGMPILIAMFAAHFKEFKDEMTTTTDKWQYYLRSLRNKDSSNRLVMKFLEKQTVIFDTCIGQLDEEIREKYEALAIFSEDVNIMPQTLQILWDMDSSTDPDISHKIADDMLILCHKSLAAKHWNVDLQSYVYGVHDLLLCHLRRKLTPEKLRDMHRSFVEKYRKYCNGDFSTMPHDNYSYSYIGHHLEQSGLHDEFPKLYLNFDFLREKIYRTGLSDLLIDLKKYRNLITENTEEGKAKVEDLETFLEVQAGVIAEHRRRKCLDLVQIGINYWSTGYVHQKCREIAAAQSSKLYVTHNHVFTAMQSKSEEVSTAVSTAVFTEDPDKILIGNESGETILWDCKTRQQTVFSGHDKKTAIIKIIVNNDECFLTLSEDGKVKLYAMKSNEQSNSWGRTSPRIHSPRERQQFWRGFFNDTTSKDNSIMTFSIEEEKITDMVLSYNENGDKRLAICTKEGTAQVWTLDGRIIFTQNTGRDSFGRVAFTRKEGMLHLLNTEGVLIFYGLQSDQSYSYLAKYNPNWPYRNVIFFGATPYTEKSLMIIADRAALYIQWEEGRDEKSPNFVTHVHNFAKQERGKVDDGDTAYTCATVTYDGQYFITGDSKESIKVWDIDAGDQPIATFKGRANSLDTYWISDGHHLICGSEDRVIHRWPLTLEQLPKSVRKPLFDAVLKPWGQSDIVAKETANGIVIHNGQETPLQTEPWIGKITRLKLNSDGNKIVYGTDKGAIAVLDIISDGVMNFLEWQSVPHKLGVAANFVSFVNINGASVVVCGERNNLHVLFSKISSIVENTGPVMSAFSIDDVNAITVSRDGIVSFWRVNDHTNWHSNGAWKTCAENEILCHSCLSPNKKLLNLVKGTGEMIVYEILKDESVTPTCIDADTVMKFLFDRKVSCCEFSQDDKYLAVGLEHGDILIFDVYERRQVCRLELHCNEVRQLHWGPISLGAPILFSVNCDELAWWNLAPVLSQKQENRRSRMGMSRSTTTIGSGPRSSGRFSASQSLDLQTSGGLARELKLMGSKSSDADSRSKQVIDDRDNDTRTSRSDYWKNKRAKDENRAALLSVVPLPPSCNSKICVSDDFRKFLSVDVHGFVSNFVCYNDI